MRIGILVLTFVFAGSLYFLQKIKKTKELAPILE
jgi:hypothetical protein